MLKYARDVKRMKLAGYRVARLLFYAGNGFLASRPSPPCAPRPGYRALFIRYERCLHGIFKTWRCSKIRAITDNFFFFRIYIYMYVRNIHVYMYVRKETCYVGSLDYPEAEQGWKISPRPTKKRKGRPLKRTDRESSQMAPDIEQSTLYKLLPAKPTVSNYLTHSKTSRKSPTPPDQAFDPISTEQRPNRICIYIYIYTILLTTNSRITLGRIDPGSPTMHERFDHRARRISRNLSARDSCALYLSLSLSLYLYASTNRAFISAVPFLFFSPFLFFLLPIFYISLPPSPLCFALPLSLLPPFFAPSTFIYPPNFFHSALALTHRKGWLEIGGKGDRAKCGWTRREGRVGGGASRGCQAQGVPVTCFRSLVLPGPLERPLERETLRSCIPGGPFESNREISRIVVIVPLLY